ncbi:MAG: hypothetical protein V2A58_16985 [Planctomycetota bacterium]
MTARAREISRLNRMTVREVMRKAGEHLTVVKDLDALHRHFARAIADEVAANNRAGKPTRLILPYGPTGQYPYLVERVNAKGITLTNATFFFMDEYADEAGKDIPERHPLSFRGGMKGTWRAIRKDLRIAPERVIFPLRRNVKKLAKMVRGEGGIGTCYGGVGLHGHLAFNEPEPGVRRSGPRLVRLNDYSVTINAIRSHIGGDLENYPRWAHTLGMAELLSARRMRYYVRSSDVEGLDWANTVLRLVLFGEPGDDYPGTYIKTHADWGIVTDEVTVARPKHPL